MRLTKCLFIEYEAADFKPIKPGPFRRQFLALKIKWGAFCLLPALLLELLGSRLDSPPVCYVGYAWLALGSLKFYLPEISLFQRRLIDIYPRLANRKKFRWERFVLRCSFLAPFFYACGFFFLLLAKSGGPKTKLNLIFRRPRLVFATAALCSFGLFAFSPLFVASNSNSERFPILEKVVSPALGAIMRVQLSPYFSMVSQSFIGNEFLGVGSSMLAGANYKTARRSISSDSEMAEFIKQSIEMKHLRKEAIVTKILVPFNLVGIEYALAKGRAPASGVARDNELELGENFVRLAKTFGDKDERVGPYSPLSYLSPLSGIEIAMCSAFIQITSSTYEKAFVEAAKNWVERIEKRRAASKAGIDLNAQMRIDRMKRELAALN